MAILEANATARGLYPTACCPSVCTSRPLKLPRKDGWQLRGNAHRRCRSARETHSPVEAHRGTAPEGKEFPQASVRERVLPADISHRLVFSSLLPWRSSSGLASSRLQRKFSRCSVSSGESQIHTARRAADVRRRESRRQDPVLKDCFAQHLCEEDESPLRTGGTPERDTEELAALAILRFCDDVITKELSQSVRDVRQMVLLSTGFELDATRPFRLPLPRFTCVFDVSPADVFEWASARLKDAGIRVPPGTLLRHVSADISKGEDWRDEGWGEKLVRMGYKGDRPSVWVLQGSVGMTKAGLQAVLGHARGLAASHSVFVGEIGECAIGDTTHPKQSLTTLFAQNGFTVEFPSLQTLVQSYGRHPAALEGIRAPLLFRAVQLRLSDIQKESAEREMQASAEWGDEEGFEDLP